MMNKKGFTLIELLIVVAIIAILAAIAIPNFLAAQTRSKVSRTKADMRAVATGIESYFVDNNAYPEIVAIYPFGYSLPVTITTPIAYMASVPLDPFGPSPANDVYTRGSTYWYASWEYYERHYPAWGLSKNPWSVDPSGGTSSSVTKWVLQSRGPDRVMAQADGAGANEVDVPYQWAYDPSNGTVSRGNIVISGP
jgi:type II secretion system protein G